MPDLSHEIKCGRDAGRVICGADEVGRGPLAGPVVAAAVVIPATGLPDEIASRVRDSKKMSDRQREEIFPLIIAHCPHAIARAEVAEIDQMNILRASLLAMRRAIEAMERDYSLKVDHALIDGNKLPDLACSATAIVKGDSASLSIAAASIIAKVTRDRLLREMAVQYPMYGWEQNAGYPTAGHLEALRRHGPCPEHRRSFSPVREAADLFFTSP